MKRLLTITFFSLVWTLSMAAAAANAQTAYGISIVRGNTDTLIVDGYSGTWLDYYAGLYYDPEVIGDIYRTDNPETSLSNGRSIGYADLVPAEVYLKTANFVEGKTYCTYSQHAVWSYYYYVPNSWWFDPFRYDLIYTGSPPWTGSPFSYYYVIPRRHFLGWTQACITIPAAPPPTPTPSPTPAPTPTPMPPPCDPGLAEPCPGYDVTINTEPKILKPHGTTGGTNTARVTVCINPALANKDVSFALVNRPQYVNTGGHVGSLHTGARPLGKLAKMGGKTGSDGCFSTTYSPTHIGGWVGINGTALGRTGGSDVLVTVPGATGFTPLPFGDNYELIGDSTAHPFNHYGTPAAIAGLELIADDYKTRYYGNGTIPENDKLRYNDMSLEQGGKFDLGKHWVNSSEHAEHREGINDDVRCCRDPGNVPRDRWSVLWQIFIDRGSTRTNDETDTTKPHWHLRFEFGIPQRTAERTPHMLIEDVFGAALERESTQSEYEIWLDGITTAKAQGQSQLLSEVTVFEQQIFDSAEYRSRQRTSEKFIGDVFWSHLFREPSEKEADEWLGHLQGIYALTERQRRKQFVIDFESIPEFQSVVSEIVDPIPPPSPTP